VFETNGRGRLGQLMARRLRKLAGLTPGKTSQEHRAIGIQPIRRSTAFTGDSLLRSLERHRSVHDADVLEDLVALMRKRGAADRGLRRESLLTRTDAIRELASASKVALKGLLGESAKSGRGDRRVKPGGPSPRRHASAISKVTPQLKAARMVGDNAPNPKEEREAEGLTAARLDERFQGRKLNSRDGTRMRMPERKQGSALIAAGTCSPLENSGRLASDHAARVNLSQKLAQRPKSATGTARLISAKSINGGNLAGRDVRAGHRGQASEGNEAEDRRGVTLKNSALAQRSLRAAQRTPRRPEGSRPALTVNFNPTVVLQAEPDQAAKKNIVEALSRHSHELVQLIEHEIAKQRRVEFAS
jgi:hypothetical protein